MKRRIGAALAAVALAGTTLGATALIAPTGAAASTLAPTAVNWAYTQYQVERLHAAGATGAGVKVAVIDNAIDPSVPALANAHLTVAPTTVCGDSAQTTTLDSLAARHGTTVTAMIAGAKDDALGIVGVAPDADVTFYGTDEGATCPATERGISGFAVALAQAINDENRIIVMSMGYSELTPVEIDLIELAIQHKIIIVAASANDDSGAAAYPWSLNGVISVVGIGPNNALIQDAAGAPVVHQQVTLAAPGLDVPCIAADGTWGEACSGSSNAAPWVAGMIAISMQKHPKASGNQMLRAALLTSTLPDGSAHKPSTQGFGYGVVDGEKMLPFSPTTLPDNNPLLSKQDTLVTNDGINQANDTLLKEVLEPVGAGSAVSASASAKTVTGQTDSVQRAATARESGSALWWIIGGSAAGAVLLGGLAVAWLRRRD